MASEQTGARKKKQSRNQVKEEQQHKVLYRHQECIPNPKLLQNCERHISSTLKNNQDLEYHGKLVHQPETNDLKKKSKELNSKLNSDGKSVKSQQDIKLNLQSNCGLGNNEELSKSRKRRLRKQRLLVSLAPNLNNNKPISPVESNIQTKSITRAIVRPSSIVSPSPSTTTIRTCEPAKPSSKEPRKRPDKSVGTRSKSIKTKSLAESTANQSKADIIKTLEEKTLSSLLQTLVPLTNSSPKKEKPSLPVFSFPEKRLNSSEQKIGKDDVFYFGETKHQLEKLTTEFSRYNTILGQDKQELTKNTEYSQKYFSPNKSSTLGNCISPFNFSLLGTDRLSNLSPVKQNLYDCETVYSSSKIENKRVFSPGPSAFETKEQEFITPVLKDLSNKFPIQQVLNISGPTVSAPLGCVSDITTSSVFENSIVNTTSNITKSEEPHSYCTVTSSILKEESNCNQRNLFEDIKNNYCTMKQSEVSNKPNKTREEILLEREAKKAAKLAAKSKHKTAQTNKVDVATGLENTICAQKEIDVVSEKHVSLPSREFENKLPNHKISNSSQESSSLNKEMKSNLEASDSVQDSSSKSKAELKAERRAKQEAQRAAKVTNKNVQSKPKEKVVSQVKNEQTKTVIVDHVEKKQEVVKTSAQQKPKLFSHLYQEKIPFTSNQILAVGGLHPAIVRLGVQYVTRVVVGSNARCVALLHALKQMVNDYTTPSEKEFSRGLEEELGPVTFYLNQCRPLAVSMTNALRHIKRTLTQLPNNISDIEARRKICDVVDTYINEQIDVAGKQICNTVKQKIANGDVILTYGCSSLVYKILVESHLSGTKFRVVVVDGLPWREGREMLRRLVDKGLSCTYVLITAASFIMREASKVLLGAHALLANGYVMSRAGSSQVALLAHCYNVPVLVCCETHKFCERVQTDAFVYNELGELCCDSVKDKSRILSSLTPLSLAYDITPPDLVSAVVTELAVLPCTSVPVILRIKPSESVM